MPRIPFRNPGNRLPKTFKFEISDELFLEMLKPWTANHYKEKAGLKRFNKRLKKIKNDLRKDLYVIQNSYCAFCGIDLGIAREVHREHIAPQSQHKHYIFEPENLVLACYDCNDFKGKKRTVDVDTGIYSSSTFLILHPYRDHYGNFLVAYYENGGLWFELLAGVTDDRAKLTIEKLGLQDPKLIKERGMRIRNNLIPATQADDKIVNKTCAISPRKAN